MSRLGMALLTGAVLAASGCYRYVPARAETVAPAMRVRAYLSPEAAERVRGVLGSSNPVVEGRWVESTPEGVYLEVPSAVLQEGYRTERLTQKLLIAPGELELVQRRELDRFRTAVFVGAAVVAGGIIAYDALSGRSGESIGTPITPGGPEARLPILRIRFW